MGCRVRQIRSLASKEIREREIDRKSNVAGSLKLLQYWQEYNHAVMIIAMNMSEYE